MGFQLSNDRQTHRQTDGQTDGWREGGRDRWNGGSVVFYSSLYVLHIVC